MPSIAESLLEEGRSKGVAQGVVQGRNTERRELLESLMLDRFGTIPSDVQTWIATTEDSNALRTAILQVNKADSLDDLRELGLFAHRAERGFDISRFDASSRTPHAHHQHSAARLWRSQYSRPLEVGFELARVSV